MRTSVALLPTLVVGIVVAAGPSFAQGWSGSTPIFESDARRTAIRPVRAPCAKHALVQEAAYASLLHCKRLRLHGQIVDALNKHFPEIIEEHPELMGHHLAEAGLAERAIEYLQRAGEPRRP
jgi:hypothetical protein